MRHTATYDLPGIRRTSAQSAETVRNNVLEIRVDEPPALVVREGSVDIDELVHREELTAEGRAYIEQARRELAGEIKQLAGAGIRTLRLERGMSQATLAEAIGTSQPHMARIESGRTEVQTGTIVRLATALGVPPAEVLSALLENFAPTEIG